MVTARRRRGDAGEDRAARMLEDLGYTVVGRNVRTASGEIDIVAVDGATTAFVEVRWRRAGADAAALSVTPTKLRRMWRCALEYCAAAEIDPDTTRIDVIALDSGPGAEHFRGVDIPGDPAGLR